MPIYHFNVHDGSSYADPTGHEMPTIEAAKSEAVVLAGNLIRELGSSFWDGEDWRMEVTDHSGLVLFTLHFLGMMSAAGRGAEPPNQASIA